MKYLSSRHWPFLMADTKVQEQLKDDRITYSMLNRKLRLFPPLAILNILRSTKETRRPQTCQSLRLITRVYCKMTSMTLICTSNLYPDDLAHLVQHHLTTTTLYEMCSFPFLISRINHWFDENRRIRYF